MDKKPDYTCYTNTWRQEFVFWIDCIKTLVDMCSKKPKDDKCIKGHNMYKDNGKIYSLYQKM